MAKILGQLERAQYENVAGNPSTALAVGRFWIDITAPTAGVPKYYNGTQTMQLGTYNTNAIGNSGSGAVTINWALGVTQTLTLTGNVVISHSNMPTNGQVCTLIVTQNTAVPLYQVRFSSDNYWQKQLLPTLIPANASRKFTFISTAAFLPAITSLGAYTQSNPSNITSVQHFDFSPDGNWIAYTGGGANAFAVQVYQGPLGGLQFGSYISSGAPSVAGNVTAVAFHPSGAYVAVASATTPFIQVFPFAMGTYGTQIANPASLPAAAVNSIAWSPAGDALVYTSGTTPFIGGYPFTNGVFGTKYANPGTLPTAAYAVKFHPSGLFVAIGLNAAPGIAAYAFTTASGFGTKSTAPTPSTYLASQNPEALSFSPDGLYVALGITATPFITAWPFSGSGVFGTVVANPAVLPAGQCFSVNFAPKNDYLYATTQTGSTVLYAYPWTGAYGTLGSNPTVLPPTTSLLGGKMHPTSEFIALFGLTTPFLMSYATPRVVQNYMASQF